MIRLVPHRPGARRALAAALGVGALAVFAAVALAGSSAKVSSTSFKLFPNKAFINCAAAPGQTPTVNATVTRGTRNDTLTLNLAHSKPSLGFDLFTVQRSNQNSDGTPVSGFTNFGLAWYQSDIETS